MTIQIKIQNVIVIGFKKGYVSSLHIFEIRLGQYNKFIEYKTLEWYIIMFISYSNNNLKQLFKDRGNARNNNEMSDETIDIYIYRSNVEANIAIQETYNLVNS